MRVLLDEGVDWRLARLLDAEHEVVSVRRRGWASKTNGDLLRAAEAEFDALITLDRGLPHQQHLPRFDLAVILITARSNRRQDLAPALPEVNRLLREVEPRRLYVVAV